MNRASRLLPTLPRACGEAAQQWLKVGAMYVSMCACMLSHGLECRLAGASSPRTTHVFPT